MKLSILKYMIKQYRELYRQWKLGGYEYERLRGYLDCVWDFAVEYKLLDYYNENINGGNKCK